MIPTSTTVCLGIHWKLRDHINISAMRQRAGPLDSCNRQPALYLQFNHGMLESKSITRFCTQNPDFKFSVLLWVTSVVSAKIIPSLSSSPHYDEKTSKELEIRLASQHSKHSSLYLWRSTMVIVHKKS